MSFLHLTLLALGGAAVGIPVALHLLMRPRPKTIHFPAVRFLARRQKRNQRRLQLQHWSLLAARMLIILLLAAALARPRVPTAQVGSWTVVGIVVVVWLVVGSVFLAAWWRPTPGWLRLLLGSLGAVMTLVLVATAGSLAVQGAAGLSWTTRQAPVAAALVFDTSPRMAYRFQDQTRLQRAQQLARGIASQLPQESTVAIFDGTTGSAPLTVDPISAGNAIDSLIMAPDPMPFSSLADEALHVLDDSRLPIRELYLFTDLSQAAWQPGGAQLTDDLADHPEVNVHVVDVGVAEPNNTAIARIDVSEDTVQGGEVEIRVTLRHVGPPVECQVECLLERPDPTLPVIRDGRLQLPEKERRGRERCELAGSQVQTVVFRLVGLTPGTYHGEVRIIGQDGLAADDSGFFTLQVAARRTVAVVGGSDRQADYLISALDPPSGEEGDSSSAPSPFDCWSWSYDTLGRQDLGVVDAVALLDPPPLADETWQSLHRAVGHGTGLAIFLGRHASSANQFNTEPSLAVLPGKLERQWRAPEGVTLGLSPENHPVTRLLHELDTTVPWSQFPVFRHWTFNALSSQANVLVRFSNGQPALIERHVGRGVAVVMATPVSDAASHGDTWNLLPTGFDPWPFVVLMDQLFQYLTAGNSPRLNYRAGDPVDIPAWGGADDIRYQLFTPAGQWQELSAEGGRVSVRGTDSPGIYRLRNLGQPGGTRGFAVNWPADATRLERLSAGELERLTAADNVRIVRRQEEIQRGVSESRMGIDAFAFFAVVTAMLLALESFLSNWFYPSQRPHISGASPQLAA